MNIIISNFGWDGWCSAIDKGKFIKADNVKNITLIPLFSLINAKGYESE